MSKYEFRLRPRRGGWSLVLSGVLATLVLILVGEQVLPKLIAVTAISVTTLIQFVHKTRGRESPPVAARM